MDTCPCGSNIAYEKCFQPLIKGEQPAKTAEQLMRSRYSAYVKKEIDYLYTSLHHDHRANYDEKTTRTWAESNEWHAFEILNTTAGGPEDSKGTVEFKVVYSENGAKQEHHEISTFEKHEGNWYFVSGTPAPPKQVVRATPKVGRNDPCPCGSGKKYKKCCGQ